MKGGWVVVTFATKTQMNESRHTRVNEQCQMRHTTPVNGSRHVTQVDESRHACEYITSRICTHVGVQRHNRALGLGISMQQQFQ